MCVFFFFWFFRIITFFTQRLSMRTIFFVFSTVDTLLISDPATRDEWPGMIFFLFIRIPVALGNIIFSFVSACFNWPVLKLSTSWIKSECCRSCRTSTLPFFKIYFRYEFDNTHWVTRNFASFINCDIF